MTTSALLSDELGPWFRVLSLPARRGADHAEHDYADVLPAALSAARAGRPLVIGWLCRGPGRPLELLTNAAAAPPRRLALQPLLFPPGGSGASADAGWREACETLVWGVCPGRQVQPFAGENAAEDDRRVEPTRFEAALAVGLGRPFAWLIVAEPAGAIDAELAGLRMKLDVLRRQDLERSRLTVERAERRLAELDAFHEAGLWTVRVLVGAASQPDLSMLGPVLVGSAGVGHHPYRLAGPDGVLSLDEAFAAKVDRPESGACVPFAATAGVIAALAGLPRREVPGLRVVEPGQFDLTSETEGGGGAPGGAVPAAPAGAGDTTPGEPAGEEAAKPAGEATTKPAGEPTEEMNRETAVSLGAILDGLDRPVGEFRVPLSTLNRHAFVTGATGAGKSQTVRHLLEQLADAGVPWLVIEPVKSEYPGMAGRLAASGEAAGAGPLTVINPSDPEAVPFSVNPLAPEPGYPVQAHIDLVRALFLAAFDAEEPFPQVMAQALERVYQDNGWDVVTGAAAPGAATAPGIPTLAQLQRAAAAVIDEVGYGRELQADVRGFVDVRLRSLRVGSAGRFFEGGHPADIGGLLARRAVLAIEDVANDEDKAFLMGTLIIRIVEHLRLRARRGQRGGLSHVLVIEEAHRLLRASSGGRASGHAVELFASLLAEIRAYGEGLVVAEQIPAKLIPDVVKNTALKIVHRLPALDDRELVGAAMNLDEGQSRQVVSLTPGVAAVFADGMDRPLRIRVPLGENRESAAAGPPPPLVGRRSSACGPRCVRDRACTLLELRRGDLAAAAPDPGGAWLRLWVQTLVLAFLTGRPLPAAPPPLRRRWDAMDARVRECALATVIDAAVAGREAALRESFAPAALAERAADAALRVLAGSRAAGDRAGPAWVVPQLRWLHEMERVCPLGGDCDPLHRAPPLEYDLPGLVDWAGMRVGHRIAALRRHPVSMGLARNQMIAWTVLLGDDDHAGFTRDLAMAMVGFSERAQLRHAASAMEAGAWLEVVLSWPRRFVAGAQAAGSGDSGADTSATAAQTDPGGG